MQFCETTAFRVSILCMGMTSIAQRVVKPFVLVHRYTWSNSCGGVVLQVAYIPPGAADAVLLCWIQHVGLWKLSGRLLQLQRGNADSVPDDVWRFSRELDGRLHHDFLHGTHTRVQGFSCTATQASALSVQMWTLVFFLVFFLIFYAEEESGSCAGWHRHLRFFESALRNNQACIVRSHLTL